MLFSQENAWCWWRKKTLASPSEFLLMVSLHLVCFLKCSGELSLSVPDVRRSSLARWLWRDINSCRVQKCKQIWNGVVRHLVLPEVSGSRSLLFCIDICCAAVWNRGDLFALIVTRFLKEKQIITSLCMQLLNTTHEETGKLVSVGLFFVV